MKTARLLGIVLMCSALLFAPGCGRKASSHGTGGSTPSKAPVEGDQLTIAIAGMVIPESGLSYYLGLSEYIGKKVGRDVRLIHKADYAAVNKLLEEGKVDVAFVCSGPYVAGHDSFGLKLIAAPEVNGKAQYFSYIIVPKDSKATGLASLKGKIFAFADPESNTGCLVPTFMLAQIGQTPNAFFSKVFYTYAHDNSIKAVAQGKADGAAVDSLIWDYQNATDPKYTSQTKVVQRSEGFATPPVVARPGLDPALISKVKEAFLAADQDPEGKALLGKMKVDRFVAVSDSEYDSIRRMSEQIEQLAK